jgi:uncharacterized membrane protein YeaQ/YmgE (transglycosylase-associated protein family)
MEVRVNIIWTIVIGFVAGAVAKFLTPGKDGGGFILTTVLGVAGAVVANVLGRFVGWYGEGEGGGFIASVVGAVIILLVFRLIRKPRSAT